MPITQQSHDLKIPQAQIWFGPDETVLGEIIPWLQKQIVHVHKSADCYTCSAIRIHEHSSFYWIKPEKNYVLEDIEPIFHLCSLKREEADPFFIVLQSAELLSIQCANSLLKLVEEPPVGYHFMFLTNKIEAILPTVRSRCHIHTLSAAVDTVYPSVLLEMLLNNKSSPAAFAKELDTNKIDEIESMNLLNDLITISTQKSRTSIENDDITAFNRWNSLHSLVLAGIVQPPMPGSSKLFWRNLYLNMRVQ